MQEMLLGLHDVEIIRIKNGNDIYSSNTCRFLWRIIKFVALYSDSHLEYKQRNDMENTTLSSRVRF